MTRYWRVERAKGLAWNQSQGMREQPRWDEHAVFMDGLAEAGFVVMGGPVGEGEGDNFLLVVDAEDEAAIRRRLAQDPWPEDMLSIRAIQPWSVVLRAPGH